MLPHQLRIRNGKKLQLLGFLWLQMLLNIWSGQLPIERLNMTQVLQVGAKLFFLYSRKDLNSRHVKVLTA